MQCKDFQCIFDIDGECDQIGGECIGDMCENYGECIGCQEQEREECDGIQ